MQVITLVLVVLAVVAVLFAASAYGMPPPFGHQHLEECQKEFNVTTKPDWESNVDDMPDNMQCFVKCLVSKIGLVSDNGGIDEQVLVRMYAKKHADPTMDMKEMINGCKSLLVNTTCRSMAEFFLCIKMDLKAREH